MKVTFLAAMALCAAGSAGAQDAGPDVSLGLRLWNAEWTTFSYFTQGNANLALTQVAAQSKLVLVPALSLRYRDWVGSLSVLPSTRFDFVDGGSGTRQEVDANVGYSLMPGLALTLGYKKVSQRDGATRYEPAGLVAGVNGNASLGGAWSMYGGLGIGRLSTPQSGGDEVVKFDADYHLTEVGLAYALPATRFVRRWTLTGGYRIQVLSSKEALGAQSGRDTTEGFTLGAIATF